MLNKIEKFLTWMTDRKIRTYSILLLSVILGLIVMHLTTVNGYLDEIDLNNSIDMVLFIMFLIGMFTVFTGISILVGFTLINKHHEKEMERMRIFHIDEIKRMNEFIRRT